MILINMLVNLRRLPGKILRACVEALPSCTQRRHPVHSLSLASSLTCLSPGRLYKFYLRMVRQGEYVNLRHSSEETVPPHVVRV